MTAPTDSAAFRRWFRDSKVVDRSGNPLVVFHGAPDVRGFFGADGSGSKGFRRSLMRGNTFFATDDLRTAESYTDPHRAFDYQNAEPGIIPLFLSIQNPLILDAEFKHWRKTEDVVRRARAEGHDGVIILNSVDLHSSKAGIRTRREDASTVFVFFDPTQAKVALTGPMKARSLSNWHQPDPSGRILEFTGPNDGSFDSDDPDFTSNRKRRRES